MTAKELLEWAKNTYKKEKENRKDYSGIVYILRNSPDIEKAGLSDLCWAMTSINFCGYLSEGDIEGLLDSFEKYVNENSDN